MPLKALLFDFNGVIIHDESIHEKLVHQLLIEENLCPKAGEFRQFCLGRSDRTGLKDLFNHRGRFLSEPALEGLMTRKAAAYCQELSTVNPLPIYPGVQDLIFNARATQLKLAIVTGALRSEVDLVLERAQLSDAFSVVVSSEDSRPGKPEPAPYLLAVDRLNHSYPDLHLKPSDCLAIEDTFTGIAAAKQAGIPVVGVANSYPFHMLQRRANWTVDYLTDLELDRIRQVFNPIAA